MKTKFSVEITVEADNQEQAEKDLAAWCRIKNSDSISVNETRFTRFEPLKMVSCAVSVKRPEV